MTENTSISHALPTSVGAQLRRLRLRARLSQLDLALQ